MIYAHLTNNTIENTSVWDEIPDDQTLVLIPDGTHAGIGYTYNPSDGRFTAPQPYPSWTLDANDDWQPPTAYPDDGDDYMWDEEKQQWHAV